jgi:hypothetical protein
MIGFLICQPSWLEASPKMANQTGRRKPRLWYVSQSLGRKWVITRGKNVFFIIVIACSYSP